MEAPLIDMLLKACGVRSWSIIKMSSQAATTKANIDQKELVRKEPSLMDKIRKMHRQRKVNWKSPPPRSSTTSEQPVSEIIANLVGKKRKFQEEEEKEEDISYYTKEIEVYEISDREEWLAWRKLKIMPSASMISSFYGEGYRKFKDEVLSIVGKLPDIPPSAFLQKMLNHGNEYESAAKDAYLDKEISKDTRYEIITDGKRSYVMEISVKGLAYQVLATPDMIIKIDHPKVIEIKCPTYGILMKKKSSLVEVADEFLKRYPTGKLSHFIQASFYALLFNCQHFEVFCYFTNGVEYHYICFRYELIEILKKFLFCAIAGCHEQIRLSHKSEEPKNETAHKKMREVKPDAFLISCAFRSYTRGSQEILEEESPKDGKE